MAPADQHQDLGQQAHRKTKQHRWGRTHGKSQRWHPKVSYAVKLPEALAGARYRWDETWGKWGNVVHAPRHRLRSGVVHSGFFVDSITFEMSTTKTDICGHALENRR